VAVLRITPFRRLWMALGLSSFGDWLGLLATAAFAQELADDSYTTANFAIAGVFILRLAPAVLLGPLAGAIADRLDRRWTLVVSDMARCALFASIPVVGTLGWLYAATLLVECFALFWLPAKDATVPNLVPRRRLGAANRVGMAATYGTAPLAALVFAALALFDNVLGHFFSDRPLTGVGLALWFNAVTFLACALTIARLDLPAGPVPEADRRSILGSVLEGWRYVGRTPLVRGVVLGMLGAFSAAGLVIGLARTFVADLGAGDPGFGVLFGSVFVGLAAGMWVGPRILVGVSRRRLFGLALSAAGIFLILLALVPNVVMAALFTAAVGTCGGIAWVTGYTLIGQEVDDEVRGRTFGFLQSAARVVLVLVLAVGPVLAGTLGTHTFRFSERYQLTYNGSAWVFLFAGLLALSMGLTAYQQMDDRRGTSLLEELRSSFATGVGPSVPAERRHPGCFIALEGGDGSGKSTQARLLRDWLADELGHEVVTTREPGATLLGTRLREMLLSGDVTMGARAEALLFAADRADHVRALIAPALERGAVVITDRYVDSSVAYQGAGRELDPDQIARLSRWATDGLVPDLTILLDLPPEISRVRRASDLDRSGEDRMESQSDDFHDRVRQGFLDLARREPHRYLVLDGSDPRQELHGRIRDRVRDLVPLSASQRAELSDRLGQEDRDRARRARVEAEVLRMDARLRAGQRKELLAREESRRLARRQAERELDGPQPADGPDRSRGSDPRGEAGR